MEISIVGLLICGAIWFASRLSAEPSVFGLIVSFSFGSTAVVILPALGGSSPLVYVVFLCGVFTSCAMRPSIIYELGDVFSRTPIAWVVLFLIFYVIVGAFTMPRIFAGQTTIFVPLRAEGRMGEMPLAPVNGNITQSLYFVLGALSFFACRVLFLKPVTLVAVRQGLFVWATLHVGMGYVDLLGKITGLGDVLAPIRTASYVMLTDVTIAGFFRISGAYSEASSFGATTVALLAFTFTCWRASASALSLTLSAMLLSLLVLSTSSTAYVGGIVLAIVVLALVVGAAMQNRLRTQDLFLLAAAFAVLTIFIGMILYNEHALDPFGHLFDVMVFDKGSSSSAQERAYWNYRSLQSLYDTTGFGIGLGSSRASSWIIAVISQLGAIGTTMIAILVFRLWRGGCIHQQAWWLCPKSRVTVLSVRAAALATLVTASIGDGSAYPGTLFFIGLAAVSIPMPTPSAMRYQSPADLFRRKEGSTASLPA